VGDTVVLEEDMDTFSLISSSLRFDLTNIRLRVWRYVDEHRRLGFERRFESISPQGIFLAVNRAASICTLQTTVFSFGENKTLS
jgi:hypothetical protein